MPVNAAASFFFHALAAKPARTAIDICEVPAELRRKAEVHQAYYRADRQHQIVHSYFLRGEQTQYKRQCHQAGSYLEQLGDIAPRYIFLCYFYSQFLTTYYIFKECNRILCKNLT